MIKFENVSFSYPGEDSGSLHDINLTVQKGECILLCGRSGCGKTTITRLINGLIPFFFEGELKGSVHVGKMDIAQTPLYQIASHVGSVFQNPRTQFFNMDTDGEIAFGIENQAMPPKQLKERVEQTVKDLEIEKLCGRNIFELSGGEKQKIAFASIYAMNPDVYLLDEPSSNLDMTTIDQLRKQLAAIKAQGKTIIIAEHRIHYLMDIADKILYMEKGYVKQVYTPESLSKVPAEKRKKMGLRALSLQGIPVNPQEEKKTQKPVLELRDVTLKYKKRTILEHISLTAEKGEVIAVVGHNGAGKTTFSRGLCGLHKKCEGGFFWKGKKIDAKTRRKLSYMVMQDVNYELFAESVEAECTFGIKNPDKELAQTAMKELGIWQYRERHPNTLSGGQKQRTAVAVSMVCQKDILVFDEPTSGLDYDSMVQVAELINNLSEMGKVIFVVTHDYEFVCRSCSRVLHFDEGEMPDDILVSVENEEKLRGVFML